MDLKDTIRDSLDHVARSTFGILDVIVSVLWEWLAIDLDTDSQARKIGRDRHIAGQIERLFRGDLDEEIVV